MATIRIPSGSSALTINSLIALSQVDDRIVFFGEYTLDETLHFLPDRRYYGKGARFDANFEGYCVEMDTNVPEPRRAWYKRAWRWVWVHIFRQQLTRSLIKDIHVFYHTTLSETPDGIVSAQGNQVGFHFPMQ